jgi:ComF family protein
MDMSVVDTMIGALAPHLCVACGCEGYALCPECLEVAGEPLPGRCAGCKKLSKGSRTCKTCRNWLEVYSVRVASPYEGVYEQLLIDYKFEVRRAGARPIARVMSEVASDLPDDIIVCPVPTAPSRIRERGFDHIKLVVKYFCKYTSLPQQDLLGRRSNVRQFGSSRSKRLKQMKQEFYLKDSADVKDKNILLIDDVITTGASLSASAHTLKQAGAKRIYAVIYSQKN